MAQRAKGVYQPEDLSSPRIHFDPLTLGLKSETCVFVNIPGRSPGRNCGQLRWSEMDRVGRAGTHQEEGTHSRDLVELHQQAQGLLVVATVLLVHTELVLLQDKGRAVRCRAEAGGEGGWGSLGSCAEYRLSQASR